MSIQRFTMATTAFFLAGFLNANAYADAPQPEIAGKTTLEIEYRPVPPTADELAARDLNNPKKDGALVLHNTDLSTAPSRDTKSPNFYYYHGTAVPLPLDVRRIA